ncbi:hypothetical protein HK098_002921 [Nowakowskiella sp. JEL0407]|nr:hypothetical protein HK098_002921 [Nowakowskiella sp. JEL0407]
MANIRQTNLKDIKPSHRDISTSVIVLDTKFSDGGNHIWVADETGSFSAIVYGRSAKLINPGDKLKITSCRANLSNNVLELIINENAITCTGQDTMVFSERPNFSHFKWMIDEKDPNGPLVPSPVPEPPNEDSRYFWLPRYYVDKPRETKEATVPPPKTTRDEYKDSDNRQAKRGRKRDLRNSYSEPKRGSPTRRGR